MGRYLLGRIAGLVGVLVAVSAITFFLMHSVPSGPFDIIQLGSNITIPDGVKKNLEIAYGLDKPLWQQYLIFMNNALHLNFGYSFAYQTQTVSEILANQWPYSAQLGLLTLIFSVIVGGGLGIAAAMNQGTWIDYLGTGVSIFCLATPGFVLAVLMQLVFSVKLHWVPTGGWDTPSEWIMPVLANSLGPVLVLQRFTRASVADVLGSNYVRTARAKGMSAATVTFIHVFKNALTPLITIGGPMAAGLITGSFFIESIFRIPGVGQFFVTAAQTRDYPLIMATTLATTALISVAYLLTDLAYAVVDPRVTFVKES
jgi:ABC-type dipeptide/oligopeptide/nickel transport system permease component